MTSKEALESIKYLLELTRCTAKNLPKMYKTIEKDLEELKKQKEILDILKERLEITISKQVDDYDDGIYLEPSESYYICEDTAISKNEYKLLKEWLENDI